MHLRFLLVPFELLADTVDVSMVRRLASDDAKQQATQGASSSSVLGNWKIPATMGFALIGFLQWTQLNHPTEEERKNHPAPALQRLPGKHTHFEETMATKRQVRLRSLALVHCVGLICVLV